LKSWFYGRLTPAKSTFQTIFQTVSKRIGSDSFSKRGDFACAKSPLSEKSLVSGPLMFVFFGFQSKISLLMGNAKG
jgi:hypothetical protein